MVERLKEIPKRLLEYWNKWTKKQRTIVISAISGVILLVAILVAILGRTVYVELYTYNDTKTASSVVNLLKDSQITTKLASDNTTVLVDKKRYSEAIMTVATSDLADSSFGIDGLLDTSITTTNAELLIRETVYTKEDLRKDILATKGVLDAKIQYQAKDTSHSVLATSKTIPVSVKLVTGSDFKKSSAIAIAKHVAFALGNPNTDDIVVTDQDGNVLFDGQDKKEEGELDYNDKIAMREYFYSYYRESVLSALLMNGFTQVEVSPNLALNFDKMQETFEEYLPYAEGEDRGVLIEYHETASNGTNGTGDIPGTDPNDETDYYLTEGGSGEYSTSTMDGFYQPNHNIKSIVYDVGTVSAQDSSIAVTARKVITRTEEELQLLGLLEDVSFDEYVVNHSEQVLTPTDERLVQAIAMATGIPLDKISLMTYEVYEYIPKVEVERNWTFYLQILLAVLLVAFLMFVIFRGTKPVEVTELEPDLSVEQLLATTKENQSLEDVEFSEQSETRRMIEKFFDENPEAVAALLRNWLNSDWE